MANTILLPFLSAVVSALENCTRCTFVSFVFHTIPTMRKTNNPYIGRVTKVNSASRVLFNANYIVRDANGNPLPSDEQNKEKLPWGAWRVYRKTIDHKGKVYGRFYFLKGKVKSIEKVSFLVDGRPATDTETKEIWGFIGASNINTKDIKIPRTYDLTNLVSLTINGKTYDRSQQYGKVD